MFAMGFAKKVHMEQVRAYTNEPYIVHPFAVAGLVTAVTNRTHMIVAAFLHDVVEDTPISLETIQIMFGDEVSYLVENLTDVSEKGDGNRAERRAIDLEHTAKASPDAKTIKLADIIDNVKTITAFDPKFAKVYMAEKRELMKVLKEGDNTLYNLANKMIETYYLIPRV